MQQQPDTTSTRVEQRRVTSSRRREVTSVQSSGSSPHHRIETRTTLQISDMMSGGVDTARDSLLKWAQRTTHNYPGVRVTDFTSSWRDGLALCAILHRNRPDLLDFQSLRSENARHNLELAFNLAEREFGITRLLDLEDVDTGDPDEKSLIIYVSGLYDVFPEPPPHHPLAAQEEKKKKMDELEKLNASLQSWMSETTEALQKQPPSNSIIDLKNVLLESAKFQSNELPKHLRDKKRLSNLCKEIQKSTPLKEDVEKEVEEGWRRLSSTLQERDKKVKDEISRLERLQRIVDKTAKDMKSIHNQLDDLQKKISERSNVKLSSEAAESEFKSIDSSLKALEKDVASLEEKQHPKAKEMNAKYLSLTTRHQNVRSLFERNLSPTDDKKINEKKTSSEKVSEEDVFKEQLEWIDKKQKRIQLLMNSIEVNASQSSLRSSLDQMKSELKSIEQFNKRNISNKAAKETTGSSFEQFQMAYKELLTSVTHYVKLLEDLLEFVQSVSKALRWMGEREEVEVGRDWTARNINFTELEHFQESLMGELEKEELCVQAIQNTGHSLLPHLHTLPAAKLVQDCLNRIQNKWSWILQLATCLEIHIRHAKVYQEFHKRAKSCEEFLKKAEGRWSSLCRKKGPPQGELTQFMEELCTQKRELDALARQSGQVVPLRQRRQPPKKADLIALCKYTSSEVSVEKSQKCVFKEVCNKTSWKVCTPEGKEGVVPAVCFLIPPPDTEATQLSQSLQKRYEELLGSLQHNSVSISVEDKGNVTQRESVVNNVKIVLKNGSESKSSSFKETTKKEGEDSEQEPKAAGRKLFESMVSLLHLLKEKEKTLKNRLLATVTHKREALEDLVLQHKEFESGLRQLEGQLEEMDRNYKNSNKKTTALQKKYSEVFKNWNMLWDYSNLYIKKLKGTELVLVHVVECVQCVSGLESSLASFGAMSSDVEALKKNHAALLKLEEEMRQNQSCMDALQESVRKLKNILQSIQSKSGGSVDCGKVERDAQKILSRWESARSQIIERLRSCGASSELLRTYKSRLSEDNVWITHVTNTTFQTSKETEFSVKPIMQLYTEVCERKSSLDETNLLGSRYLREAKAAVQENFKVTEENAAQLKSWMEGIEAKLREIGVPHQQLTPLHHQVATVKVLVEELEGHQMLVNTCLDQMRLLAQRGLEVLTREEMASLQTHFIFIQEHYDLLLRHTHLLCKRLSSAHEQLHKFKTELHSLKEWLSAAHSLSAQLSSLPPSLSAASHNIHQIRSFTNDVISHQADLRFITMAANKFYHESEEFVSALNTLRANFSKQAPPLKSDGKEVKSEVQEITTLFHDFLNDVYKLSDNYTILLSKYRIYTESAEKAQIWLNEMKKSVCQIVKESVAEEPSALQAQLDKIKVTHLEVIGQSHVVESVLEAYRHFTEALATSGMFSPDADDAGVGRLQEDYSQLYNQIANRIQELQVALVRSQDIQVAIERHQKELLDIEARISQLKAPISLMNDEQMQECRVLKGDVENFRQSLDVLLQTIQKRSPEKKGRTDDLFARCTRCQDTLSKRLSLLQEVFESVRLLQERSTQLEEWLKSTTEKFESTPSDSLPSLLEYISKEKSSRQADYNSAMKLGEQLTSRKDVCGVSAVVDRLQALERGWCSLEETLDRKRGRVQACESLSRMERRHDEMGVLTLKRDLLEEQLALVTRLLEEHSELSKMMLQLQEEPRSPSSNKKAAKNIQQESSELNNRYQILGTKMTNRKQELLQVLESVKSFHEILSRLNQFVEQKSPINQSKESTEDLISAQQEMLQKQTELETLKMRIHQMIQSHKNLRGSSDLQEEIVQLESRLSSLVRLTEEGLSFSRRWAQYRDQLGHLEEWLQQRGRMLQALLGPIAPEPHLLTSQMQQLKVIREEFNSQQNVLKQLKESSFLIREHLKKGGSSNDKKVAEEVDRLSSLFREFSDRLAEREQGLEAALGASEGFFRVAAQLQNRLQSINDKLDSFESQTTSLKVLHKKVSETEEELLVLRSLLNEASSASQRLAAQLTDKEELLSKMAALEKSYSAIQRRIDSKKAETESYLKEETKFLETCKCLETWLQTIEISRPLSVTTDVEKIAAQLEEYERLHQVMSSKEHEVHLHSIRGADLLSKIGDKPDYRKRLEAIHQQFVKIKQTTIERISVLRTVLDICQSYRSSLSAFESWMRSTEEKLKHSEVPSLDRDALNTQIKEIHVLRSEMAMHSPEYQRLLHLGQEIQSKCDTDRDKIKKQVDLCTKQWKTLDETILSRVQAYEELCLLLLEYEEKRRGCLHDTERLQDRLHSIGESSDKIALERIKELQGESEKIKEKFKILKKLLKNVAEKSGQNPTHMSQELESLEKQHRALLKRLEDEYASKSSSYKVFTVFMEHMKNLESEVRNLEEKFDSLQTVVKDHHSLKSHLKDLKALRGLVSKVKQSFSAVSKMSQEQADTAPYSEQISFLGKKIEKMEEQISRREETIQTLMTRTEHFYEACSEAIKKMSSLLKKETWSEDTTSLKNQQEKFQKTCESSFKPLSLKINEINRSGQELILSASSILDTRDLEHKLNDVNNMHNDLQKTIREREKQLETLMLQSGKFQDALVSVQTWLQETEHMVHNQRPPSYDLKVVRAQIQEQKFLQKMLSDRKESFQQLREMSSRFPKSGDTEKEIRRLEERYQKLVGGAQERADILQRILPLAQGVEEAATHFLSWVEGAERRITSLHPLPAEEEHLRRISREHTIFLKEMEELKSKSLGRLSELSSRLKPILQPGEQEQLLRKTHSLQDRFSNVETQAKTLSTMLRDAEAGLSRFSATYQKILHHIEEVSTELPSYERLSVCDSKKLSQQLNNLTKLKTKLEDERNEILQICKSGEGLMKMCSGEQGAVIQEKVQSLQSKHQDTWGRVQERWKAAQEFLPLVEDLHSSLLHVTSHLDTVEKSLKGMDRKPLQVQRASFEELEERVQECVTPLDTVQHTLQSLLTSGGEARGVERQASALTQRLHRAQEQLQTRRGRVQEALDRKQQVMNEVDELNEWLSDVEKRQCLEEGKLPPEPTLLSSFLKEHKVLCDELSKQNTKIRSITSATKNLARDASFENFSDLNEKSETLKVRYKSITLKCQERLQALEQASPLCSHFFETHRDLSDRLDELEKGAQQLETTPTTLSPAFLHKQHQKCKDLIKTSQEHKVIVDRLNKTGSSLVKICQNEEVEQIMESDNSRYVMLRKILKEQQIALEESLQATSEFMDKLESILGALNGTADLLKNAEPIGAHPSRIAEQLQENRSILQELDKRADTLRTVKETAGQAIHRADRKEDVKDLQLKLDHLSELWGRVESAAQSRGRSLEEAMRAANIFWEKLGAVTTALKELQSHLSAQEPPALEPSRVQRQQEALKEIKQDLQQTEQDVEECRSAGRHLLELCGEPEKPEVKKQMETLNKTWVNVTALYSQREQNLIEAMDKAMRFHEMFQKSLEFLETYEEKFSKLEPVSSDIDRVKSQQKQLSDFKAEVNPHVVELESLRRQARLLMEGSSSAEGGRSLREPLREIDARWEQLSANIAQREQELEKVLLRLGQFQHALEESLQWIERTERSLGQPVPLCGDQEVIGTALAKHKVILNDIQAHQSSIDSLWEAGQGFVDRSDQDAQGTYRKLQQMKDRWQNLVDKFNSRNKELEEALKEAQKLHQEIQEWVQWVGETDAQISATKAVGGLPETARDQLSRFMDLYNELESNRYKIENLLKEGQNYANRSEENNVRNLLLSLQTLKQKWEALLQKANDKKIKLEIALRESTEFQESLQGFLDWLTNAEKYFSNKTVSRHLEKLLQQIEEHRAFQKDLSSHREVMLSLDKRVTQLKCLTQKQDVVLIRNLLASAQARWEKVVSRAADRTRQLDIAYKEAKEFHDTWTSLMSWLEENERALEGGGPLDNEPFKIKQLLSKHKDFQRALSSKQGTYEGCVRGGRALKDKCPKQDAHFIQEMVDELKARWNGLCSRAVDKQRELEDALLVSGQFREAASSLLEWMEKSIAQLTHPRPHHGDTDTVRSLLQQHKAFTEEMKRKESSLDSVCETALRFQKQDDLLNSQVVELRNKWQHLTQLKDRRTQQLQEALQMAEDLQRLVQRMLEWFSAAESRLRFPGALPDSEGETLQLLGEHEAFCREMGEKESLKEEALNLAHSILDRGAHPDAQPPIKHWINILQSRWEEMCVLRDQRERRLREHLSSLRALEELLRWLREAEDRLTALEAEPLPQDQPTLQRLIQEHQDYMAEISSKQKTVDKMTKGVSSKRKGKTSPSPARGKDAVCSIPLAEAVAEKWRLVWLLAMERQKRLQEWLHRLQQMEFTRNFDFEDWRHRYLNWLDNKRSRVMDQFKKMDKKNVGKLTKEEFIEGLLKSKFRTSRPEMERVADIFDRNGDGSIDSKEYVEVLRLEKENVPKTEAEKIEDEVQRQVAKCTCEKRFKVYQVGEGKYRFGDSQKLRLVRILRSTVMVRVGGGWVALDEFLVKNDPCRAKGRTNLELREEFILAEGVSQSLAPFKPKTSPQGSSSVSGPITKIREKSERSTPMKKSASSERSGSSLSEETQSSGGVKRAATPEASRSSKIPSVVKQPSKN